MLEFLGLVVLSWWTILFLGGAVLWTTHTESEAWALFWMVGLITCLYFIFNIPLTWLLIGIAAYIPIGLGWSVYRFKRFCKDKYKYVTEAINKNTAKAAGSKLNNNTRYLKDNFKEEVKPSSNIDKIVIWVLIWPFSLIDNLIGDLLDLIEDFIKKYLIKIYENIANKYLDQIN